MLTVEFTADVGCGPRKWGGETVPDGGPVALQIKFLKSKDGCAMVQMGDPLAVERAVGHLNNAQFFDTKMQLGWVFQFDLS